MENRRTWPFAVTCIAAIFYLLLTIRSFGESLPLSVRDTSFPEIVTPSNGDWTFDLSGSNQNNDAMVGFEIQAPGWDQSNSNPSITLRSFGFNEFQPQIQTADRMCFEHLELNPDQPFQQRTISQTHPLCYERKGDEIGGYPIQFVNQVDTAPITFTMAPQQFWYPYDFVEMPVALHAHYYLMKGNSKIFEATTTPLIVLYGENLNKNWVITPRIDTTKPLFEGNQPVVQRTLVVRFERPFLYRVIYPVLVGVLVVLTGMLAAAQSASFLEGAIALFLGVIGLRQLLIPNQIATSTLFDALLLGVYVIFIIPLSIHVYTFFKRRQYGDKPHGMTMNVAPPSDEMTRRWQQPLNLLLLGLSAILMLSLLSRRFRQLRNKVPIVPILIKRN